MIESVYIANIYILENKLSFYENIYPAMHILFDCPRKHSLIVE